MSAEQCPVHDHLSGPIGHLYGHFYGYTPSACSVPPFDDRVADNSVLNIAEKSLRRGSFWTGYILVIHRVIRRNISTLAESYRRR